LWISPAVISAIIDQLNSANFRTKMLKLAML
jgi:hypothetical protein